MFSNLGDIHSTATAGFGSTPNAFIAFFAPRRMSRQFKRPLSYEFSNKFAERLVDGINKSVDAGTPSFLRSIVESPEIANEITPSSREGGYAFSAERLSDNWTFMLVIDNDSMANGASFKVTPGSGVRTVIQGYCNIEPISANKTPNPSCVLYVTHVNTISKLRRFSGGSLGYSDTINNVANVDYIDAGTTTLLSSAPGNLQKMTPADAFYAYSPIDGMIGRTAVIGPQTTVSQSTSEIMINSRQNSPTDQMATISNALYKSAGAVKNAHVGGDMNEGRIIGDSRGAFVSTFSTELQDRTTFNGQLCEGGAIILNTLMNKYRPKIEGPFKYPDETMLNIVNQEWDSADNMMCAMLANVVPSLLSNYGLSEIGFRVRYLLNQEPITETNIFKGFIPMTDDQLQSRVVAFLRHFKSVLVPMISQGREFDLQMACCTTGMTRICMNFLHDPVDLAKVYEVPTILGGLNSPLIGTENSLKNNGQNLVKLVEFLSSTNADLSDLLEMTDPYNNMDLPSTAPTFGQSSFDQNGTAIFGQADQFPSFQEFNNNFSSGNTNPVQQNIAPAPTKRRDDFV